MHTSKPFKSIKDSLSDGQIAKAIFLRMMQSMKEILTLGEFKIGDRQSEQYRYFKKVVMDQFYVPMSELFDALQEKGIVESCECGADLRHGYKPCPLCGGSGFKNTEDFQEYIDTPIE